MFKNFKFLKVIVALVVSNIFFIELTQAQDQNDVWQEQSQLISPETEVDYNKLANFLSQKQWRKANDETTKLLLEATGRDAIGWARTEDVQKLSCWDLDLINQLWQDSSDKRFGFSSQFPIYLETGNRPGKLISDEAYNTFGDRLGWRADGDWIIFVENLNYSIDAPIGHFPNPRPEYSITGGRLYYSVLAERMVECKVVATNATNNQFGSGNSEFNLPSTFN